jgi:hypothetical protein
MQEAEIKQDVLKRLHKKLTQFVKALCEITYLSLLWEQPEIICFAEEIKELSGYNADETLADIEEFRYTNRGIPLYQQKQ